VAPPGEWKKELEICLIFYIFANFGKIKNILKNQKFWHHPDTMGYVCTNFCIYNIFGF